MVLIEDKHYQIIPDRKDDKAWNARILSGIFTGTVLRYGVVKFNGEKEDMTFNFDIVYSPDTELKVSDVRLQEFAGIMLGHIMENGVQNRKEIKNAD